MSSEAIRKLALRAMSECFGRDDEDDHRELAVRALEELWS